MEIQQTLAIIKPDGVLKGVADAIRERYEKAGLEVNLKMRIRFTQKQAEAFYRDHQGKFFMEGLVLAMTSGICEVLILQGENAIEAVRKLNGATNPAEAEEGTIRHDFRSAGGPFNTVHGSDSPEAYLHELTVVTSNLYK